MTYILLQVSADMMHKLLQKERHKPMLLLSMWIVEFVPNILIHGCLFHQQNLLTHSTTPFLTTCITNNKGPSMLLSNNSNSANYAPVSPIKILTVPKL